MWCIIKCFAKPFVPSNFTSLLALLNLNAVVINIIGSHPQSIFTYPMQLITVIVVFFSVDPIFSIQFKYQLVICKIRRKKWHFLNFCHFFALLYFDKHLLKYSSYPKKTFFPNFFPCFSLFFLLHLCTKKKSPGKDYKS